VVSWSQPRVALSRSLDVIGSTDSRESKIDDGIARPSAFAVVRLTISSNFVGCSTGKSVTLQATGLYVIIQAVHRRETTLGRKLGDSYSVSDEHGVQHNDDRANVLLDHRRKDSFDFTWATDFQRMKPDSQRLSRILGVSQLRRIAGVGRIPEESHAGQVGNDLRKELELFADELAPQSWTTR
jgi:hypothetical protein